MKFKFSLNPVLKVKKHKEKLQKQKLAEEISKKKEIEEMQHRVQEKLQSYLKENENPKVQSVHDIKRHNKHMEQVHMLIKKLKKKLNEAEDSVSKERDKLAEVHKSRHVIEKVKEFEQKIFNREIELSEQKFMDEISTQSFNRS